MTGRADAAMRLAVDVMLPHQNDPMPEFKQALAQTLVYVVRLYQLDEEDSLAVAEQLHERYLS